MIEIIHPEEFRQSIDNINIARRTTLGEKRMTISLVASTLILLPIVVWLPIFLNGIGVFAKRFYPPGFYVMVRERKRWLFWIDLFNFISIGKQKCMDGFDEDFCKRLEFNECEDDEYRCVNGICIPDEYWLGLVWWDAHSC